LVGSGDLDHPSKTAAISANSPALAGRSALVTGGGRGIGAAVAERFLELGAHVFICARTVSEVESTVSRLRERFGEAAISGLTCDLENPASIPTLFEAAERAFGRPADLLVNNAAIGYAVPFLETSPAKLAEEWDRMSAINVRAPLLLSHEFMRRIPRGLKGAAIVNIGSLGGIRSTDKFPGLAPYVMTKFAIAGMTEALAVEGRPIGVRVNAVAPGAVDTEMLRKAAPHLKTETLPADVANVIVTLCDPFASGAITGSVIEIHSNL
jgi:NAD(P)-dependent dehydrogenase (short-subunit alcohol dehydrogenase family)